MNMIKSGQTNISFLKYVLIILLLSTIASCGNNTSPNGGFDSRLIDITTNLNVEEVSVMQNQSVTITVDITAPNNVIVSGYTIDMPEDIAKIDIETASCTSGTGTASCQEWTITPRQDAIPGRYILGITPSNPSQSGNLIAVELDLYVTTNLEINSAPAAISISGKNPVLHVISSDLGRWSWANSNSASNAIAASGAGGYFRSDAIGSLDVLEDLNPIRVDVAALPTTPEQWVSLDGNFRVGLGVNDQGEVFSWGDNEFGMLGYVASSFQTIPRQITRLSNATQVTATYLASFALIDGEVIVWGGNGTGLHGIGSTDFVSETTFSKAQGLNNVISIKSGRIHVLALKSDGTVWSWGSNQHGNLGLGTVSDNVSIPTQIPGLANILKIDAADNFSIALRSDGTVWSWGDNRNGQLGLASSEFNVSSPQQVTGFGFASDVVATNVYSSEKGFVIADNNLPGVIQPVIWSWGNGQGVPQLLATDSTPTALGANLYIDDSCGLVDLPDGSRVRSGFVWNMRNAPLEIPKLIPFFGKKDPSCKHKLFLNNRNQGVITSTPPPINLNEYSVPTEVQLTVTPNPGFLIDPNDPWDGDEDCDDGLVLVEGGVQCIANFVPVNSRQLTVQLSGTGEGLVASSPSGINCGIDCDENYAVDTTVTLTAITASGSTFVGWSGDFSCSNVVTGNNSEVRLLNDVDCIATFDTSPTALIAVTKNGLGDGTVTSSVVGIDCGNDCDEAFSIGTNVSLSATADANSTFTVWSGTGDCQSPSPLVDGSIAIIVSQDSECIATFDPVTTGDFVLTVIINGGPGAGEVFSTETPMPIMQCTNSNEVSTTCTANFSASSGVTLVSSMFLSNNLTLTNGCDTFVGANLNCFVTMDQDKTVVFNISQNPEFDISASVTGSGTIRTFGIGEIIFGSITCPSINCSDTFIVATPGTVIFEAHPDPGATFVSWGVGQCDSEQIFNGIGVCNVRLDPGSPTTRQIDAVFQ